MTVETPLLAIEDLSVEFRSRRSTIAAVKGLGFSVGRGETVALVGESGSGKSVTALSILRLIEREGGTIAGGRISFTRRDGAVIDLAGADEGVMRAIRGDEISMIFQEPMTSLNPVMTVGAQIAEVLVEHQHLGSREALARSEALLRAVRMPDPERRLRQYPGELSGGMRQRVMIAMALSCRPSLLIADEPTTALDVTIQAEILQLIRVLQREIGMAVLFITHDMGVVAEIADRVVVMRDGAKVEENAVRPLFAEPRQPYTRDLLAAVPRLGGGGPAAAQARQAEPVLVVRDLVKRFPLRRGPLRRTVANVHAVEHVSFSLAAGETLGLVGESGCGKSTTGRTLTKLLEPTSGTIRIRGRDVTRLSPRAMRPIRRDIQMVFQDPYAALNPRLTAFDLVTEPLAIHGDLSVAQRRDRAVALLERVGLSAEHLGRYPHQFSGGQRQRLCIARALSVDPGIIIADEPVSALDVSVQARVIDLLRDLQEERGLAYLFISHDMAVIEQMSHRVAVMFLGQIVEIGPTKAVLHDPRHPYTQRLLAAAPVPDPQAPRRAVPIEGRETPSPIRRVGEPPARPPLVEVAPGHFIQVADAS